MDNSHRSNGAVIRRTVGILVALIVALAMILLTFELVFTGFLPIKYLAAAVLAMAVVFIIAALLMIVPKRKGPFIAGLVLAIIACIVAAAGFLYVHKARKTVENITTPTADATVVSVFMRASDTRDFERSASGLSYGIIADRDRANTDEAVSRLGAAYSFDPDVHAFDSLPTLVETLLDGSVDAIVINRGFVAILDEVEGLEDAESNMREVWSVRIEEEPAPAGAPGAAPDQSPQPSYSSHAADQYADGGDRIRSSDGSTFAVYIGGIDSRSGLVERSRNDVNIIAVINTKTKQIALVSTPRDYYVPLSISGGARDKLTHAGIYGVQVSMDSLAAFYGIDIDYYFRVNFGGFVDIVNTLGGVTVDSDYSFSAFGYTFYEGENYLDGDAALAFVRERHAFASGDRQRGRNQLAVIKALLRKMMSPELLTNFFDLMNALEGSFETNVPYDVLSKLVRDQLSGGEDWNVVGYSVDGDGDLQIPYSLSQYAYVMVPDMDTVHRASELFRQVYAGEQASLS
ncbi:MAG: LCP family protein [Oscillospiraceae bacterium]|nr:LCP family protein [Oscillospiraceae bacterium]